MILSNNINLDTQIKQCSVIKPYQALQSNFAKKLIDHMVSHGKFKEQHIREIICKLDDESQTLTPGQGKDFLEFMQEHNDFFDAIIKRYKWQFPAWVQSEVGSDTLDMEQQDHVLYMDGQYISLDKIRSYIISRIKWQWEKNESDQYKVRTSKALRNKIEKFSLYAENAIHGDLLWYLRDINYSERVSQEGIIIHNLNGIEFISMESEQTPRLYFTQQDLNNDPNDYSKGISLDNLKNNPKFISLLKKSNAKAFESLEQSNAFHFKLLQPISDQLWFKDIIDIDFIDDPKNDWKTETIISGLHSLTGKNIAIPYKFNEANEEGLLSAIYCEDALCAVVRDSDSEDDNISFFLEVAPLLDKQHQ